MVMIIQVRGILNRQDWLGRIWPDDIFGLMLNGKCKNESLYMKRSLDCSSRLAFLCLFYSFYPIGIHLCFALSYLPKSYFCPKIHFYKDYTCNITPTPKSKSVTFGGFHAKIFTHKWGIKKVTLLSKWNFGQTIDFWHNVLHSFSENCQFCKGPEEEDKCQPFFCSQYLPHDSSSRWAADFSTAILSLG